MGAFQNLYLKCKYCTNFYSTLNCNSNDLIGADFCLSE